MLKEVSIEIIRKCPNCCLHCSSLAHKQCNEIMPLEKFKEVVSDAAQLGAKTICLSGGEPFLHNDIVDMVRTIKEYNMDCYIYTSGIVLDKWEQATPISLNVLEAISQCTTKIIFNIEAGTEHTYDIIMGTKNCFDKMQQSAIFAAKAGICTEAHFVPMAINIEEISDVILLCKKLKIKKLSFLRLVLHGRAKQNKDILELTEEKTKQLKEKLNELQKSSCVSVRVGVPLSLDTSCHKCEAAKGKLNIKYDGEVYPCEVFKNYSMRKSLGDLRPESIYNDTLHNIYNNSEYLSHIRKLSKEFSGACETCVGQHLMKMEDY